MVGSETEFHTWFILFSRNSSLVTLWKSITICCLLLQVKVGYSSPSRRSLVPRTHLKIPSLFPSSLLPEIPFLLKYTFLSLHTFEDSNLLMSKSTFLFQPTVYCGTVCGRLHFHLRVRKTTTTITEFKCKTQLYWSKCITELYFLENLQQINRRKRTIGVQTLSVVLLEKKKKTILRFFRLNYKTTQLE